MYGIGFSYWITVEGLTLPIIMVWLAKLTILVAGMKEIMFIS